MSKSLPYSIQDLNYDNDKSRQRPFHKVAPQLLASSNLKSSCTSCSIGKFLSALLFLGLLYLLLHHSSSPIPIPAKEFILGTEIYKKASFKTLLKRSPPFPPQLAPDATIIKWKERQQKVKEAFLHAWSGYKKYAMGFDELMPVSQRGIDGLGGLGATIVDALDTAMILDAQEVVADAGAWIEHELPHRITTKGQVNLFETTIRIMGGLLSAYHLSLNSTVKGPKPETYLQTAVLLADRLLLAFNSSSTPIPFSDVVLSDPSAHKSPDGLSSTAEVATLQLEFNYLSAISGDPKYSDEAMKVLSHMKDLPKVDGLVPIYISPDTGSFVGENIRLGSRGDSYYEYLIKVYLQQGKASNVTYLRKMYEEAIQGVKKKLVQKSIPKGLVFVGELPNGPDGDLSPKMDHLVCFLPGALALGATKGLTKKKATKEGLMTFEDMENIKLAEDLAKTCVEMYKVTATGLAPEIAYFHIKDQWEGGLSGGNKSSEYLGDIMIKAGDRHNLLRPETVESLFVLYRVTDDQKYREWGWEIFEAFEKHTKVEGGGYSSLDDVTVVPPRKRDKMETFFLGETLKYLYLLFGDHNLIPLNKYVFNTEAHPIPILHL